MKEKDLHKIIRDGGARDNTLLVDALKAKHPELATAEASAHDRNRIYKRLTAVFTTLSVAEAVALVLVPSLLLSGGNSSLPPADNGVITPSNYDWWGGYGGGSPDYQETRTNYYSLQEYNQANNTSFLFFSTVDYDYRIYEISSAYTDEFLGLQIDFKYEYDEESIGYKVCDKGVTIDLLSSHISICTNESAISDCTVKWGETAWGSSYGIFSYDNYDYYIFVSNDKSRLFELIQELLEDR